MSLQNVDRKSARVEGWEYSKMTFLYSLAKKPDLKYFKQFERKKVTATNKKPHLRTLPINARGKKTMTSTQQNISFQRCLLLVQQFGIGLFKKVVYFTNSFLSSRSIQEDGLFKRMVLSRACKNRPSAVYFLFQFLACDLFKRVVNIVSYIDKF